MSKPTKREMSAMWRCIQDADLMRRQMKSPDCTPDQIAAAKEQVTDARRAYLKISKARRETPKKGPTQ